MEWEEFAQLMASKLGEREEEAEYKEIFRVFSKDDEGQLFKKISCFLANKIASLLINSC